MKHNILCTIACRSGSKGVQNKNIKLIAGKPLIAHTIQQAIESGIFQHIVLSTDSQEIADIGKQYGADVFFLRDAHLSTDNSGKLPVIQDALLRSEKHYQKTFDIVIDLDATSPLRLNQDIKNAYNQFIQEQNDILITASPSRRNPYFNLIEIFEDSPIKINLAKQAKEKILCRQKAPKCYDMNASIYIWRRKSLLNQTTLFGEKTGLYIMPEERSVDIDTEFDFKIVEFLLQERVNA